MRAPEILRRDPLKSVLFAVYLAAFLFLFALASGAPSSTDIGPCSKKGDACRTREGAA